MEVLTKFLEALIAQEVANGSDLVAADLRMLLSAGLVSDPEEVASDVYDIYFEDRLRCKQ